MKIPGMNDFITKKKNLDADEEHRRTMKKMHEQMAVIGKDKKCKRCGQLSHAGAPRCVDCGEMFKTKTKVKK